MADNLPEGPSSEDETLEDTAVPSEEVSLTVCCENGSAGPFVLPVNDEHVFSLASTEIFDDVVST